MRGTGFATRSIEENPQGQGKQSVSRLRRELESKRGPQCRSSQRIVAATRLIGRCARASSGFVRAKNKCEWCGARNGEPHPSTGSRVVLTTAHVHDKRPEAASLLNLAALCQRCHLNHDRKPSARDLDMRRFSAQVREAIRRAEGDPMKIYASGGGQK